MELKGDVVKLTEGDVSEIEERNERMYNLYADGDITRKQLAEKFGVSLSTVDRALAGENWKDIKAERQEWNDDYYNQMIYDMGGYR